MRKRDSPPGDIRQSKPEEFGEQPLSQAEKALVGRAYALFTFYNDELRGVHDAMRAARMMRQLQQEERSLTAPVTSTLNSCIDNVIADQIDNMPEAVMVPEREETAQSAEEMSDVVSYALYQAGFRGTYQTLMEDAAVTGTGIAQVFWDDDLEDGDGMINVLAWHPEDFYPDPMYEDIQDGRGCFKATRGREASMRWCARNWRSART